MKFVPSEDGPGAYTAYRMSYRGEGGWWHLAHGSLLKLARPLLLVLRSD